MKRKQTTIFVSMFLLLAFGLAGISHVYAEDSSTGSEETSSTSSTDRDQVRSSRSSAASSRSSAVASRSASREELIAQRCTRVEARVNEIIDRYNTNRNRHVARYEAIADKITALIERLEEAGYDTTLIRDILNRIVAEKQSFVANYTDFVAEMEEAKQHACGESEGQFVDALARGRAKLVEARQDSIDARNLVSEELKQALEDLREQISAENN